MEDQRFKPRSGHFHIGAEGHLGQKEVYLLLRGNERMGREEARETVGNKGQRGSKGLEGFRKGHPRCVGE